MLEPDCGDLCSFSQRRDLGGHALGQGEEAWGAVEASVYPIGVQWGRGQSSVQDMQVIFTPTMLMYWWTLMYWVIDLLEQVWVTWLLRCPLYL